MFVVGLISICTSIDQSASSEPLNWAPFLAVKKRKTGWYWISGIETDYTKEYTHHDTKKQKKVDQQKQKVEPVVKLCVDK